MPVRAEFLGAVVRSLHPIVTKVTAETLRGLIRFPLNKWHHNHREPLMSDKANREPTEIIELAVGEIEELARAFSLIATLGEIVSPSAEFIFDDKPVYIN